MLFIHRPDEHLKADSINFTHCCNFWVVSINSRAWHIIRVNFWHHMYREQLLNLWNHPNDCICICLRFFSPNLLCFYSDSVGFIFLPYDTQRGRPVSFQTFQSNETSYFAAKIIGLIMHDNIWLYIMIRRNKDRKIVGWRWPLYPKAECTLRVFFLLRKNIYPNYPTLSKLPHGAKPTISKLPHFEYS